MPKFLSPVGIAGVPKGLAGIGTNTSTNTGGTWFGTDVNLFRSGNNTLKTENMFQAAGDITAQAGGSSSVAIGAVGNGSAPGVAIGADVNLYRSNTNILKTDDQFQAVGDLLAQVGTAATTVAIGARGPSNVPGMTFGGDVNLYRANTDILKTDDQFQAALDIVARAGGATQVTLGARGPASQAGISFGTGSDSIYLSAAGSLQTASDFQGAVIAGTDFVANGSSILPRLAPPGGAAGDALIKTSGADFDYYWGQVSGSGDQVGLPGGGAPGQLLVKQSYTDADATWTTNVLAPLSGGFRAATSQAAVTYGPNLTTNGTFDTNLSGWTNGGGWSWVSGAAKHGGTTYPLNQSYSNLIAGGYYLVTWDVTGRTTGTIQPSIGSNAGPIFTTSGSAVIQAPAASAILGFLPTTDFNGSLDNITMRAITGTLAPQIYVDSAIGTSVAELRADDLHNLALGANALELVVAGGDNVAIGYQTLRRTGTTSGYGTGNTAVGAEAGRDVADGRYNTLVGRQAGMLVSTGESITAVGYQALASNTTASTSTAVGAQALYASTGASNTALGYNAGRYVTTGYSNTFIGYNAGLYQGSTTNTITTGYGNTYIGHASGLITGATQRYYTTAVGYEAGTDCNYSLALGYRAKAQHFGSVAIGTLNDGTGAASAVQNMIVLGAGHIVNIPKNASDGSNGTLMINGKTSDAVTTGERFRINTTSTTGSTVAKIAGDVAGYTVLQLEALSGASPQTGDLLRFINASGSITSVVSGDGTSQWRMTNATTTSPFTGTLSNANSPAVRIMNSHSATGAWAELAFLSPTATVASGIASKNTAPGSHYADLQFYTRDGNGLNLRATFSSTTAIGPNSPQTDRLLLVNGPVPGPVSNQVFGAVIAPTVPSTATTAGTGLYARADTAAATFTTTTVYALYLGNAGKGAGSTITNNYGAYVDPQTSGSTSNTGLAIGAASGGSTFNATLWVNNTNDTTYTPSGGIVFGLSRDTNLYRSATSTLKTDTAFAVGTTLSVGNTPATSGTVNLPNTGSLSFKKATTGDAAAVYMSSDLLRLAPGVTGWNLPTGSNVSRAALNADAATLSDVAGRLAALITDLKTIGLLG